MIRRRVRLKILTQPSTGGSDGQYTEIPVSIRGPGRMSNAAIGLVLLAAVMHASWNALVKTSGDRLAILGLIAGGHMLLGIAIATRFPVPAVESWPYIAASTVIHFGYYFLLYHSYRLGDLSHVYPIARGMSPVLVALGAQVFAGETLPLLAWAGVLTASIGIFMLSGNVFRRAVPPLMVLTAMATGVIIAGYSLVDGMGVRVAGVAMAYIGWLFVFEGIAALFILGKILHGRRRVSGRVIWLGLLGGFLSGGAYGLVIYAKALAPLGVVSTLRETSVVFAALIGIVLMGERPWRLRIVASVIVAGGVILMTVGSI